MLKTTMTTHNYDELQNLHGRYAISCSATKKDLSKLTIVADRMTVGIELFNYV